MPLARCVRGSRLRPSTRRSPHTCEPSPRACLGFKLERRWVDHFEVNAAGFVCATPYFSFRPGGLHDTPYRYLSLAGRAAPSVDGYRDKLLKYVPAEINAAWFAVSGILAGLANPSTALLWVLFVVFILLTMGMIYRLTKVKNQPTPWIQIAISTVAFIVWVLALGGPFATIPGYNTAFRCDHLDHLHRRGADHQPVRSSYEGQLGPLVFRLAG